MRRLQSYVNKYGPEVGPKLYHALQSQAAHASVSARLRRKLDVLSGRAPAPTPVDDAGPAGEDMPLFPSDEPETQAEALAVPVGA